jgi:hypothetical protein
VLQLQRTVLAALICLSVSAEVRPADEIDPRLRNWFASAGAPKEGESFGAYLARVAALQHGVAYEKGTVPPAPGPEALRLSVDRFECVSFIESSLAVARCGFARTPTSSCFAREILASRYRGGINSGYASRLHYFVDWIYDNEARGRLRNLTTELGGRPVGMDFFYISRHLPGAELTELRRAVGATEESLSARTHSVLARDRADALLSRLEDGDLIAFVRERPGMLVHHAGFAYRVGGTIRLLHASSYHGRVVITPDDVRSYLLRRPERSGVIVARPLAPR